MSRIAAEAPPTVAEYRHLLEQGSKSLAGRFRQHDPIEDLVHGRSRLIDEVLTKAWTSFSEPLGTSALLAVGGYGRGELHPYSDIDILVLLSAEPGPAESQAIGAFITFLWDIGLEVGHAVRTVEYCAEAAKEDVQTLTSLLEARRLAGDEHLEERMQAQISVDEMWPADEFFRAKTAEQRARHLRYDDTAYNLEPNVKGSPGGLRDIQMILWLARRHLNAKKLEDLVQLGYLTPGQLRIINTGRAFLWQVRYGLHLLAERREDRLLFDLQRKLATLLGYEDASFTLAVEQLMQRYYRTVMEVSRLNEMLLQRFETEIILDSSAAPRPLSGRFQARNGYLEARDPEVFERDPSALLELFLLLEQNLSLKGAEAQTIALIKQNLWLIDEQFRQNPRNHRLFLDILRAPAGVTRTLKRMNTYGVLGLYIPAFGRIVGRMQYDLFHAYTVDAHTLFVVENLRRLSLPRFDDELPKVSAIMQSLEKPEVVYLAGLFHDIAKGRGGDHSELGAVDAETFCLEHGMSHYDARLVAWLVRNHLLLSITAQKRDIDDPDVVHEFAAKVGDETHLDHLYVLTVADVRGTNPKLWNSWKDTLFYQLHQRTRRALRQGLEEPIDKEVLIAETQSRALQLAAEKHAKTPEFEALWSNFDDEYFLRYSPEEIAWHAEILGGSEPDQELRIAVADHLPGGGTTVMVYYPSGTFAFALVTAVMDQAGLNIVDARIIPSDVGHNLDSYRVMGASGDRLVEPDRQAELLSRLQRAFAAGDPDSLEVTRRAPRQVRMFTTPVEIEFIDDEANDRTVMELTAPDRPGLLFRVGSVLKEQDIYLQGAKVTTVGERAEDVFFITDSSESRLSSEQRNALSDAIRNALDPAAS